MKILNPFYVLHSPPTDSLLISVPQYSHSLLISGVETSDQREHHSPTEEKAKLAQAKWNHEEIPCKTEHLAPSVKVCDSFINSTVLLLIQPGLESPFTAFSLTVSRSSELQEPKINLPAMKLNRFNNHTTSYAIKNPTGEIFTYTSSGKVRTPSSDKLKTFT